MNGRASIPNSDIHQLGTGSGTLTIGSNLISSGGQTLIGTVGNTNVISGLASTAGLFVGEPIYG